MDIVTVGLAVRLHAKPGKEQEVERFLRSAAPLVAREPGTTTWFALKFGDGVFGIFDAFPGDAERKAHLAGAVAAALGDRAAELLASPPVIDQVDVVAAKLA
ncbi:MAG TPA: antibiotic biosynthesis monooxygenase [Vicinamibacterales bacterium]|nr:antibiotic biosynthesis monooxygenase [Vicinamibacterales bacterium]